MRASPWLALGLLGLVAVVLLYRPIRSLLRLGVRWVVGLAALALFAPVGQLLGLPLGVNWINALVIGLLGLPGFGLLLLLQWILHP